MSVIEIPCQGCQTLLSLPDTSVGKNARCPTCRTVFLVPHVNPTMAPVKSNMDGHSPFSSTNPYETPTGNPTKLTASSGFDDHNPPSLAMMTIPLYISGVIYLLLGVATGFISMLVFANAEGADGDVVFGLIILMLCTAMMFALAGFIFFFTGKLKQRKKWAWITAIAFGGLYAPSAFVFLGVPILIGALNSDVQAWFNKQ